MNNKIRCNITDTNLLPKYKTEGASGMDLMASAYLDMKDGVDWDLRAGDLYIQPGERVLVRTGLNIELPPNVEAQIRPRSGLALKHGISIVNTPGTIDDDYRGDIGVILINLGNEAFKVSYGDRIAQMVFIDVVKYDLEPTVETLKPTLRGEGGFGSTGTN